MNIANRTSALVFCALFLSFAGAKSAVSQNAFTATPTPTTSPTATPVPSPEATPTSVASTSTPTANESSAKKDASPATATKKVAKVVLPPEKSHPLRIPKFDSAPVVDGKLDDAIWKQAVVLKDFYQVDPGDNTAPSKQTEVLLGYDAKTLYIAFRALDEADKVRATTPRRDQIFQDDYVGFFLDTFNDQRRAYCIFFSPTGVQADGIMTEGRGEDYSVDIVMESKGLVTQDGFTVEVAIPFKSLRYEAGKGKNWGAHFFRRIKRINNELDSWMPFSRDVRGNLNQAGRLTGLEGIATERTLEVIPSFTLSETGRRTRTFTPTAGVPDAGRLVNEPIAFEPGITAKFGLSPQITFDLAINPDFAQVEADSLVNTANLRFPIFFAERRPFFLEGIDIFQTRMNVVHTRAIVDPDVAFKVSGKRGKNTFGAIIASDGAPGNLTGDDRTRAFQDEERRQLTFDTTGVLRPRGNIRFLDKNAYIGVLRLKRDIGKENSIGLIATTYNFIEKHNDVVGIDGRFKPSQRVVAEFQVVGTTSRNFFSDPNRPGCASIFGCNEYRTGNAFGYNYFVNYGGRNLFLETWGSGRTRNYRTDVGFVQRTDTNQNGYFAGWFSDPKEKAKITSWNINTAGHINYDFRGRMQIWEDEVHFNLNFPRQSWFHVGYEFGYERLFEEEFGRRRDGTRAGRFSGHSERVSNKNHFFIDAGTTPSKEYQINAFAALRKGQFDLDFGGGRKYPRVSPLAIANASDPACSSSNAPEYCSQLDPGRGDQFEWGVNATWQPTSAIRSTLNYTNIRLTRDDTGKVAFADNLISSRTTYQFTKFIFARARIDYSTRTTNMRSQMLFGWTPSPGKALYVGYNDDVFYNFNPTLGQVTPGFTRRERQFFIKLSYLFRKSFG